MRQGLLDLIRMFPPEASERVILAEPEYKGFHHLPASSLRSVLEQTIALPVTVSYDLASVSAALTAAGSPLTTPYTPGERFAHPFSSRLALDLCSALNSGKASHEFIAADVEARLLGMNSLANWLTSRNAALPPPRRFLRLNKEPFVFQATIHPLKHTAVDVLLAQSLLISRTSYMEALTKLAQPIERRRDLMLAFADLRLLKDDENRRGRYFMLKIPPESMDCQIKPGGFGLILSDGSPDLVLDPLAWPGLRVRLSPGNSPNILFANIPKATWENPVFQRLRRGAGGRGQHWLGCRLDPDRRHGRTGSAVPACPWRCGVGDGVHGACDLPRQSGRLRS